MHEVNDLFSDFVFSIIILEYHLLVNKFGILIEISPQITMLDRYSKNGYLKEMSIVFVISNDNSL